MNAVISGRAGVAVLVDGGKLASIHAGRPEEVLARRPEEVRLLLGDAADLELVENVDPVEIGRRLERATDRIDALHLALLLLDATLSEDTRRTAAEELEAPLGTEGIGESLEGVLFARPFPRGADVVGALLCCAPQTERSRQLLSRLQSLQPSIAEVRHAWERIPLPVFGAEGDRGYAQSACVKAGLFRGLVLTRAAGESLDAFRVQALLNPAFRRLPNHRDILREWLSVLPEARGEAPYPEPVEVTHDLLAEGDEEEEERRFRGDRKAVLERVQAQKEAILHALAQRDFPRVEQYVNDLVDYQLRTGEAVHACKSLCDLAMQAKRLGWRNLQLQLTERSTRIKIDDAWSWNQYADALLNNGRLRDALDAYDRALAFSRDAERTVVARNGRAEVLRALGRLEEALSAYDQTIGDFPQDEVARNGRAEVLRTMGRLEESLSTYDQTIRAFPQNEVARNGRAEVLRAMGRLEEALSAYDQTISDFPQSEVARNGRAEVLRAMGHLEEALSAYDQNIGDFPQDVVARTGRAEVLRAMGRLEEALSAYDQTIGDFPEDVVARAGRAEVLRAMGRLEEALSAYDQTIRDFPQNEVVRNGRAEVLRAMGRLEESLSAYDQTSGDFPQNVVARAGRAEVLRAMGHLEEALSAYDQTIRDFPQDEVARNGRATVAAALGRWEEALVSLPTQAPGTESGWIGYHIRGMVLLQVGKIQEAIAIFEEGIATNPYPEQRDYFRGALALARLRQQRPGDAAEVLRSVVTPDVKPARDLLELHCFGSLGQEDMARRAYGRLEKAENLPDLTEVGNELRRRYLDHDEPRHTDQWLLQREGAILLTLMALCSARLVRRQMYGP